MVNKLVRLPYLEHVPSSPLGFPAFLITLHPQPGKNSCMSSVIIRAYISLCNFFRTTAAILFEFFDGTTDDELFFVARACFRCQGVVRKAPTSGNNKFLNICLDSCKNIPSKCGSSLTWRVPIGLISPAWIIDWSFSSSSPLIGSFSSPGTTPDFSCARTFSAAWCFADFFDVPCPSPVRSPTTHLNSQVSLGTFKAFRNTRRPQEFKPAYRKTKLGWCARPSIVSKSYRGVLESFWQSSCSIEIGVAFDLSHSVID